MRHIPAILFALLLGECAYAGDKLSAPDLSGYPQVRGFLSCIALHTNASLNLQSTNFLLISEFYRMDCVGCDVLQYSVSESGHVLDYHDPGDGSVTQPRRRQFSQAGFAKLRLAVSDLPSTNQQPWLMTLVIISHRDGTNWVMHSYGRSSSDLTEAPALRRVLDIIGERPEVHEVHPF
jgi:hypothetical protein